ncbi:MAG: hypothetical protein ACREDR_24175, partial [Blastocatellia bacterium]
MKRRIGILSLLIMVLASVLIGAPRKSKPKFNSAKAKQARAIQADHVAAQNQLFSALATRGIDSQSEVYQSLVTLSIT